MTHWRLTHACRLEQARGGRRDAAGASSFVRCRTRPSATTGSGATHSPPPHTHPLPPPVTLATQCSQPSPSPPSLRRRAELGLSAGLPIGRAPHKGPRIWLDHMRRPRASLAAAHVDWHFPPPPVLSTFPSLGCTCEAADCKRRRAGTGKEKQAGRRVRGCARAGQLHPRSPPGLPCQWGKDEAMVPAGPLPLPASRRLRSPRRVKARAKAGGAGGDQWQAEPHARPAGGLNE